METPFNAVCEGSYPDETRRLHYQLSKLEIPEKATKIVAGSNTYELHARTRDFSNLELVEPTEGGLEEAMDSSDLEDGVPVELIAHGASLHFIRTICMQDGRIFVRESELDDQAYLEKLPTILAMVQQCFTDPRFGKPYETVLEDRRRAKALGIE